MLNRLLKFGLFLTVFGISTWLQAQCPDNDIVFTNQTEIDQFKSDFPNCTELEHGLKISPIDSSDINDLEAFSGIEIINGTFWIDGFVRQNLKDLHSFSNLKKVKNLEFENSNVTNFSDDLNFKVESGFRISRCRDLASFANIELSAKMEEVYLLNLYEIPSEEYDILKQVDTTELLLVSGTTIKSLGSEFSIHVSDDFSVSNNAFLKTINGLSFNSKMSQFDLGTNPVLEGPINSMAILEEVEYFTYNGGDFIKNLPPFPSLKKIQKLRLFNLPELEDFLLFEDVIIGDEINLGNLNISSLKGLHLDTLSSQSPLLRFSNLPKLLSLNDLSVPSFIGELTVSRCDSLTNLKGLESSKVIKKLTLRTLPNFQKISYLNNLIGVDLLEIDNCEFKTLEGLESLRGIQEQLILTSNDRLENINGLQFVERLGSPLLFFFDTRLEILDNPNLNSLHAISDASMIIEELTISNNPQLSTCSIAPICYSISNDDVEVTIGNNSPGCNSAQEIIDGCRSNRVLVYHDENQNNQRDDNEVDLPIGRINVNDSYEVLPNNSSGNFSFYDAGQNAFIEYLPDENWEITGPSSVYDLVNDDYNYIEIGISPTAEIHDIYVSLAFDQIICNEEYLLTAIVINTGTVDKSFSLEVLGHGMIDQSITSVNSDGFAEFQFTNLSPGAKANFFLNYTASDVTEVTPGELIELIARVRFEDADGSLIENEKIYTPTFLCAYDPNDKQVFPSGEQEENYTLFEDNELEYKIRFQNTGNFPAQNIIIRDTLSEFLDLSTLKFINASHPVTEVNLDRNIVEFVFENIYLIDSLANEPESHGYVQFSIETLEDLDEFTEINNTAHIYFDSNPAIVTNAVFNTFVSEIPMGTSIKNLTEQGFKLMPNPTKDFITIETTFAERGKKWVIYNQLGQEVINGTTSSQTFKVNLNGMDVGLYFFQCNGEVERFMKLD